MASNKKKADTVANVYEKYEVVEVRRDQIKNAPYNPRGIGGSALRLLKSNIKKVGLLSPIVWNRRTGNIVSGHQRIASLDAINHTHDYVLKVSAVDLDEKTEKEQNVFMNNSNAQGYFNEKLVDMLSDNSLDYEAMGFFESDVYALVGKTELDENIEQMAEMSEKLHKAIDQFEESAKSSQDKNSTDYYMVLVFKDAAHKKSFCHKHDFRPDMFMSGKELDDYISDIKAAPVSP